MATTELGEGTVIDGKYRIERRLAEGGMGVVYVAFHELLARPVALKLLHDELSAEPEAIERFTVEARAASRIDHENVVRVSDFGRAADGRLYLVMELLSGRTLADELSRTRTLPAASARAIAGAILRGLEAAHAQGVVHRDLKPENVFLSPRPGADDAVKILDFGIARVRRDAAAEPRLTRDGAVMGTPHYMAPEQLRGAGDVDARADVYAVGVMLYEMLAGVPPYPGETFAEIAHGVLGGQARPLAAIAHGVDAALAAIVHKAMAPAREARFSTAAELRLALERLGPGDALAATMSPWAAARVSQLRELDRAGDTIEDLSSVADEAAAFPMSTKRPLSRAAPPPRPVAADEVALELDRPAPVVDTAAEAAATRAESSRRRRGVGLVVAAVALVLAALAGARLIVAGATAPPPPATVTVRVADAPGNARVFVDGLATTTTFTLPGDKEQHRLRLSAPGYADKAMLFVPDADQTIDGRMTRSR